eukprot:CAMPEP_0175117796 /NCGR_PEP_ID=MMETSP0086_2-20121207/19143_1 /TAXON_ID=136419 /ORGANISM="Unknown Unknown, Strain D1" /LENGTH=117 /DNA_ID=CAMNT_0016398661 /DNA_START=61 /DNA_END=411 /DNA_ORIENTATION=-
MRFRSATVCPPKPKLPLEMILVRVEALRVKSPGKEGTAAVASSSSLVKDPPASTLPTVSPGTVVCASQWQVVDCSREKPRDTSGQGSASSFRRLSREERRAAQTAGEGYLVSSGAVS